MVLEIGYSFNIVIAYRLWKYNLDLFQPEESLLWGRRRIYKEEPEITENAIRNIKMKALITIFVYPIIFIVIFVYSYSL